MRKKGWIRIMEATIAILIVSGVLVVLYTRQPDRSLDAGEYVYNLQKEILNDISSRQDLRNYVLSSNNYTIPQGLNDFVESKIPTTFGGRLVVCNLTDPPEPCKLSTSDFIATQNADIFVEETIISANLSGYTPKKARLFIWENR